MNHDDFFADALTRLRGVRAFRGMPNSVREAAGDSLEIGEDPITPFAGGTRNIHPLVELERGDLPLLGGGGNKWCGA